MNDHDFNLLSATVKSKSPVDHRAPGITIVRNLLNAFEFVLLLISFAVILGGILSPPLSNSNTSSMSPFSQPPQDSIFPTRVSVSSAPASANSAFEPFLRSNLSDWGAETSKFHEQMFALMTSHA
jgi:hypothetical protein